MEDIITEDFEGEIWKDNENYKDTKVKLWN